jgi:hypothetical protein
MERFEHVVEHLRHPIVKAEILIDPTVAYRLS